MQHEESGRSEIGTKSAQGERTRMHKSITGRPLADGYTLVLLLAKFFSKSSTINTL